MYCASCGKPMAGIRMSCSDCGRLTPAFWLNAYSLAIWFVVVVINVMYLWKVVPVMAHLEIKLGLVLPLPMRLHIWLISAARSLWLLLLLLAVGVWLALRWRKIPLPDFLKSGKVLAVVTWLAMWGTMLGLLSAFIEVVTLFRHPLKLVT